MSIKNDRQIHRKKFNDQLQELLQSKKRTKLFTQHEYKSLLEEIKIAYQLLNNNPKMKKFGFIKINDKEILISANNDPKSNYVKQYVHDKQLFDILDQIHNNVGHGEKKKMIAEIQAKFANITHECINLYLSLCQECSQYKELKSLKKNVPLSKQMVNKINILIIFKIIFKIFCQNDFETIVHWQLIIIDMTNNSDGKYKYILNYNNPMTNFCILKPLKNNSAKLISKKLASIIGLIGPPSTLSSNYGEEFVYHVLLNLKSFFPNLNIKIKDNFHGSESKTKLETLLQELCQNHFESSNWSKWLSNFQLSLNNSIISTKRKNSPFEAFFHRSSNFNSSMDIFSFNKEELQKFFKPNQTKFTDKKNHNNVESRDDEHNYILYDIFNDWKERLKFLKDPTK